MSPPAAGSSDGTTGEQRPVWQFLIGAVVLTVAGVVGSIALSIPGVFLGVDSLVGFAVTVVLSEAGYAVVAVGFVLVTGRGLDYFDIEVPSSWLVVAAVTGGAFVFRTAVVAGAVALDLDPSPPSVVGADLPVELLVGVLILASIFVIGPAEELLFRGTIQKYLRERLSPTAAILGAGLLFASVHVPTLVVSSSAGLGISIGVIFVVGLALGWLYETTGSLVAAMVAHSGYNVLIFASALLLSSLL